MIAISIHVLREEDDGKPCTHCPAEGVFLSTSSERRTTQAPQPVRPAFSFLSMSSARRTTRVRSPGRPGMDVSIHFLREEDDAGMIDQVTMDLYFYPRPPRGGRPYAERYSPSYSSISIHVLREEDDRLRNAGVHCVEYFYLRPPRGGRPGSGPQSARERMFLSTSSARRTTRV